jgi:hypothetical protein
MKGSRTVKTKQVLSFLALCVLLAFGLMSCALTPVSIDQRITSFTDKLNSSDRSHAVDDFHPSLSQDASSGALNGYDWSIPFPLVGAGTPYSITSINESNPSNVTATINGPGAFGGPKALKLVMALYNTNDWRIQELWLNGSQVIK